jgi:hypothetical protein
MAADTDIAGAILRGASLRDAPLDGVFEMLAARVVD